MASIKANCRKVVCIGRNYADHITELSSARPSQPFYFLKPPSSILPPNSGPCIRPRGVKLHYEVELGLVIGKRPPSSPSPSSSTLPPIKSYLLAIDMTARNVQDEAKRKGLPWSIAKGFDTFLPISSEIPKSSLPEDPHSRDVQLYLQVNGEERQRDATDLMLFRIPRLLGDIDRVMRLEEGDVVITGTPKGVGEVKGGDVMTAGLVVGGEEIEEARMEVKVQDAQEAPDGYVYKET